MFRRIFGPHICGDALDIFPSNGNVLTGSWRKDNSVQIWDFNSGELIRDVPDDFNKSMVGFLVVVVVVTVEELTVGPFH